MSKEDKKLIRDAFIEERECGHTICDFDDERHDLAAIAETLNIDYEYDDDDENLIFSNLKDEERVREGLKYYYELHS